MAVKSKMGTGYLRGPDLPANLVSVDYTLRIQESRFRKGWLVGTVFLHDGSHINSVWKAQTPIHLVLSDDREVEIAIEDMKPDLPISIEWKNPVES